MKTTPGVARVVEVVEGVEGAAENNGNHLPLGLERDTLSPGMDRASVSLQLVREATLLCRVGRGGKGASRTGRHWRGLQGRPEARYCFEFKILAGHRL